MADKPSQENLSSELPLKDRFLNFWESVQAFVLRNQTASYTVLGLLVAGVVLWGIRAHMVSSALEKARDDMGQAYLYLEQQKNDSAIPYLQKVAKANAGIETAKAALLLGDIQVSMGQPQQAAKNYEIARSRSSLPLIEGSAMRGLAVCAIDVKDYAKADKLLSEILSKYQRVTGDTKDRGLDKEPRDLLPFLSQVMWQQVLVHSAQGDSKGAQALAGKLIKLYPQTDDAQDARRFLAVDYKG